MKHITPAILFLFAAALVAQNPAPSQQSTAPSGQTQPAAGAAKDSDDDVMIDMSGGEAIPTAPDPPKKATAKQQPGKPTGPQTARWNAPPDFGKDPAQLKLGRMVTANGLKVIASVADYRDYQFTRINLEIVNQSGAPVHFDRTKVILVQTAPSQKPLKQLDANKLAAAIEHQDYMTNQADRTPGMTRSTFTPGVAGGGVTQGNKSTITYNGNDYIFTEFVGKTQLKSGDLENNARAVGGVYFLFSKDRTGALLRVPIGQVTFEIPFEGLVKY